MGFYTIGLIAPTIILGGLQYWFCFAKSFPGFSITTPPITGMVFSCFYFAKNNEIKEKQLKQILQVVYIFGI